VIAVGVGVAEDEPRVAADGSPVWPVADVRELEALERLAERFGATVERTTGTPHDERDDSRERELVLGVGGPDAEDAARLYARLTGRRLASAAEVASRPAVVVLAGGPPQPDMLEQLYDPAHPGDAPGLVWGRTRAELLHNVKLAAAAAHLQRPADPRIAFVNPEAPRPMVRERGRVFAGGQAAPAEIRALFADGRGATAIVTHSDGIDAGLGQSLLLCAVDKPRHDADRGRAPRCITTGTCHRLHRPVAEVLHSDAVMHPDDIAAPILVWGACFGVMAPDGAMDPAWGLADRFLANPRIGVVVTAWEVSYVVPPLVLALLQALEAGASVGEAVAWINRSPNAVSRRFRLCILGDPRVRLAPPGPPAPAHVMPTSPPPSRVPADALDQLTYLRLMLGVTEPAPTPEAAHAAWRRAVTAVHQTEVAWMQHRAHEMARPLREAVLAYVVERGPLLYHGWIKSAHVVAEDDNPICSACGHPHHRLVRYRARFHGDAAAARIVSFCPGCSVIEDVPESGPAVTFGWHDGAFVLDGDRPGAEWDAALVLVEQAAMAKRVVPWPADADGKPASRLRLDAPLPVGPVDAVLVLVHGWRLVVKAQKTMMRPRDVDVAEQASTSAGESGAPV
jgi:hypothetical protein